MARRNGERLASAKAFITEQIRTGQEITVQQVQEEFADVATCRSIYRWIAQARAAVDNPGHANHRNMARAYITDMVDQGRRCRVVDVLAHFPGVASTTTIYRWLNEARRTELGPFHTDEISKRSQFGEAICCGFRKSVMGGEIEGYIGDGGLEGKKIAHCYREDIVGEQPEVQQCQDQDTALALIDLYTSNYRN